MLHPKTVGQIFSFDEIYPMLGTSIWPKIGGKAWNGAQNMSLDEIRPTFLNIEGGTIRHMRACLKTNTQ